MNAYQPVDEKYGQYLCSREWAEKRQAVINRCRGVCERCRVNPVANVHHLTYVRKYNERLEDLQGLCRGCHEFIHAKSTVDMKKQKLLFVDALPIAGTVQ